MFIKWELSYTKLNSEFRLKKPILINLLIKPSKLEKKPLRSQDQINPFKHSHRCFHIGFVIAIIDCIEKSYQKLTYQKSRFENSMKLKDK